MKKSDLKTGDLIVFGSKTHDEFDDLVVRVYKDTENGDIVSGTSTWFPLRDRTDDQLFGGDTGNEYVWFEEVYRPKTNMAFASMKPGTATHTLLWKRVHKSEAEKELEKLMVRVEELNQIIAEEKKQ